MKKMLIILAIGTSLILLLGMKKSDLNYEGTGYNGDYRQYWKKVTDYQIIHAADLKTLQEAVKGQLKHGLRPMGDLSQFDKEYCQVMVMAE